MSGKDLKVSGTTHNVFGIRVGVSINLFVKTKHRENILGNTCVFLTYARTDDLWRKEEQQIT